MPEHPTVVELFEDVAARHPRRAVLFVEEQREAPLSELLHEAGRLATGLRSGGVAPGTPVGIALQNGSSFLTALFGVLRAGAVAVPLPLPFGRGVDSYVRHMAGMVTSTGLRRLLVDNSVYRLRSRLTAAAGHLDLLPVADLFAPSALLAPAAAPDDLAIIQHTSGSTGDPKGVALTHRNIVAGLRAIAEAAGMTEDDTMGLWVPLFHDMGLFGLLSSLLGTGRVVLWRPTTFLRRPEGWLGEFTRQRCTLGPMPTAAFEQLLSTNPAEVRAAGVDLSAWRLAFCGADPVEPELMDRFLDRFGPLNFRREALFCVYGMAEATLAVAFPELGRGPVVRWVDRRCLGTGGRVRPAAAGSPWARGMVALGTPVPGMRVRVVSEGTPVRERLGRIEISGASVADDYHGLPGTFGRSPDGWLRTGDLGFLSGGEVYVAGREADVLTTPRGRHFAEDVEAAVRDLPGVHRRRCAATPTPSAAVAVVVETASEDEQERAELADAARAAVRTVLGPVEPAVLLWPAWALPHTSSGKLRRYLVRDLLARTWPAPGGVDGNRGAGPESRRHAAYPLTRHQPEGHQVRHIHKVLINNRGEIAVRVARACRDSGIASVAVYADPDVDAVHVRAADEAYALGGRTAAESHLDVERVLRAARAADADAVHPGYGFAAEDAEFAQAVIDAGLVWVGPPPQAILALGDKIRARRIAHAVGAPLAPGTTGPVENAVAVTDFARRNGLPVAIKAVHGGGGRGLKVAWSLEEIPELYESAVREATAAFGNGACFAERYLDRPRHVETQCLADRFGNVVVISTRDCTLQRRHQKLVEEAPAPFLTPEQVEQLYQASKAILREAGYVGAGTCEFLIGTDGTVSFLEVNTRLQVEHPVSEEVTGIDLVCEQLRLASGESLGYDDPPVRGHAMEFRINAEDPAAGFVPALGTIGTWRPPSGPGVRLDSGVEGGTAVGPEFDSLLAKLVITGRDRHQVLRRAQRALAEFEVGGVATTLPFHLAVIRNPAFAGGDQFTVHTRWAETELDPAALPAPVHRGSPATGAHGAADGEQVSRQHVTVEVNGRRLEVAFPADLALLAGQRPAAKKRAAAVRAPSRTTTPGGDSLTSPMQGTVVKVAATDGRSVAQGDLIVVLEAMKMEHHVNAHKTGTVTGITTEVGSTVASGAVLCEIRDST